MEAEADGGETEPDPQLTLLGIFRFLRVLSVYKQSRFQEAVVRGSSVTQ